MAQRFWLEEANLHIYWDIADLQRSIIVPDESISRALSLSPGEKVHQIIRKHTTHVCDGVIIEATYLPLDKFPSIDQKNSTPLALCALHEQQGYERGACEEEIFAGLAPPSIQPFFEKGGDQRMLIIQQVARDAKNNILQFRQLWCCLPENVKFRLAY